VRFNGNFDRADSKNVAGVQSCRNSVNSSGRLPDHRADGVWTRQQREAFAWTTWAEAMGWRARVWNIALASSLGWLEQPPAAFRAEAAVSGVGLLRLFS